MINKKFIFILSIAFVIGFIFSLAINKDLPAEVCFEETCWNVEVADTEEERAQGLMFRENLPENAGMWFVFPEPGIYAFWMKNTLIPLDVLYFDEEGKFVSVQTMNPCEHDPCKTYPSARPAKYALEVNAGFAEKEGVGEKWRLEGLNY